MDKTNLMAIAKALDDAVNLLIVPMLNLQAAIDDLQADQDDEEDEETQDKINDLTDLLETIERARDAMNDASDFGLLRP